jgi:regulator of protease activity HflC (stomatin/prohibitin superfamily)
MLALIILLFGSWYTVDQGERGVKLRYGKIVSVSEPGLGLKLPLMENIIKISVQNQSIQYRGLQAYSRDQQPAQLMVSVSYHVPASEVSQLYSAYGSIENMTDRLISRQVPTQVENTFGQYTAISAVQDRVRFVKDLTTAIKGALNGPVVIDSIQVENIDFSQAYEHSIEDRMKAEVAIATRKQNLETEKINASIAVTQAQASADAQLAQARAAAESIRLRGSAEAESIRLRGEALRQNPEVVNLTAAERWNGQLPQTMIPGSTVPFVNIQNQAK